MVAVGVYDAKTHLPQLVERVRRGERIVITKHGRAVAQLVPAVEEPAVDIATVIEQMEEWQKTQAPTLGPGLTVRELREAGRRF